MAISGIVVTLSDSASEADSALDMLAHERRITLGERFGRRVAAVTETASAEEDGLLWDDLHGIPGVARVDVTFVGLDRPASENGELR